MWEEKEKEKLKVIEKTTTLKADKIDNTGAIKRKRWNGLAPGQYSIGYMTLSISNEVPK